VLQAALRVAEFGLARSTAVALRQERPSDTGILSLYGDAMWSAGLFEEARQAYEDAVTRNPDEARAHNGLARVFSARIRYTEALAHALTAVRLAPDEGDFSFTLGSTYQRMGRYPEAATALERFITLLPRGENDDRALLARSTIKALRAFGKDVPNSIAGSSDAVYVLPFRLSNEKNHRGRRINRGPEMEFVVDTGAELATVSRRAAERSKRDRHRVYDQRRRRVKSGCAACRLAESTTWNSARSGAQRPLHHQDTAAGGPADGGARKRVAARPRAVDGRRLREAHGHAGAPPSGRCGPPDETMALWLDPAGDRSRDGGGPGCTQLVVDTGGQVISISTDTAKALPTLPGVSHIALKVYGASDGTGRRICCQGEPCVQRHFASAACRSWCSICVRRACCWATSSAASSATSF